MHILFPSAIRLWNSLSNDVISLDLKTFKQNITATCIFKHMYTFLLLQRFVHSLYIGAYGLEAISAALIIDKRHHEDSGLAHETTCILYRVLYMAIVLTR